MPDVSAPLAGVVMGRPAAAQRCHGELLASCMPHFQVCCCAHAQQTLEPPPTLPCRRRCCAGIQQCRPVCLTCCTICRFTGSCCMMRRLRLFPRTPPRWRRLVRAHWVTAILQAGQ